MPDLCKYMKRRHSRTRALCQAERSEQRERSRSISDSFTRQRETGTGFRVREALHFLKLINGTLH
jgi:hypothetical protein